jgi:hypothetical protein
MTQNTESGKLAPDAAAAGDPELARICELGQLMTLSPQDLIAKLKSDTATTRLAEANAQDRPGGDPSQSVPAVAALASLASIVATLQRDPLPPLRPGHASHVPAPQPAPTSQSVAEKRESRPASSYGDRGLRQQTLAAALGLIAGLAAVAATLLWLGGWLGAIRKPKVGEPAPAIDASGQATVDAVPPSPTAKPGSVSRDDTNSPARHGAPGDPTTPAVGGTEPKPSVDNLVQEAVRRIESGDVAGARKLLAGVGNDPRGLAQFTLAETYDPNMLAAWGARDIAPDLAKAKALYGEALSLGYARAGERLNALK